MNAERQPSSLSSFIAAQGETLGGVPVVLFDDVAVSAQVQPASLVPPRLRPAVRGLGAAAFTLKAYALQSRLGALLLDGPDVTAEDLSRVPVLALNFHDVTEDDDDVALRQLEQLADLQTMGESLGDRRDNGCLVGFYDSYRRPIEILVPRCEALGLQVVFFPIFQDSEEPGRDLLNDAELASLANRHEIGFHTRSHVAAESIPDTDLQLEVTEIVERITGIQGRGPMTGAWRGGRRFDDSLPANRTLRSAGVKKLVSNWSLETIPAGDS